MTEHELDGALHRLSAVGADLLLEAVHNRLYRMSRDGDPHRAARELRQWEELLGPGATALTDRLLAFAADTAFQEGLTGFRHRQRARLDLFARVDAAIARGAYRSAKRLAPLLHSYLTDLDQFLAQTETALTVKRRLAELSAVEAVLRRHPTLYARWNAVRKTLATDAPGGPEFLLDGLAQIEHMHVYARAVEEHSRSLQEAFDAIIVSLGDVDPAEIDAGSAAWPIRERLKALERCLQTLEAQSDAKTASASFHDLASRLSRRRLR